MKWFEGHNAAHAREIGHVHVPIVEAPGDDGVDVIVYSPSDDLEHHHHELRWWEVCYCDEAPER